MSARLGYYPRRRRTSRKHIACIGIALTGIAIGVGGSVLWPWGFAPAPGSLAAEQEPAPGRLLIAGEDAALVQADTLQHHGPPPMAAGSVLFVRGSRHGRMTVRVICISGGMLQIGAEPAITWRPTGSGITDRIAEAACVDHPMLRDMPAMRI